MPRLDDGVVRLRELRPDDVDRVLAYVAEPGMYEWTTIPRPYHREHAESFIAEAAHAWADGSGYRFAVESGGRFAGVLDLRPQPARQVEVGFALMTWARGRGLMTRALRMALTWAFEQKQVEVAQWRAHVGNWPSRRVAWALGFRVDGMVPGLVEQRGQRVDGWIAGLRRGQPMRPAHPWLVPEPISGANVVLREHRAGDVPRLIEARDDPKSRIWVTGTPSPFTPELAAAQLERVRTDQATGRAVSWVIADRTDDRLLGEVMIFIRTPPGGQGEIGYCTHPDARRRGVTIEAVRLAVRHALLPLADGGLGLDRMLLRAGEGNAGSRRIAELAGFSRTGVDRQAIRLPDGSRMDDLRFDLLADELPPVR